MNVVDSSAWLEYFADGPNAAFFAPAIEQTAKLLIPTVCLYEVFKRVLLQRGEGPALQAIALMQQGTLVDLDGPIALTAARLSSDLKLPMADSIVLASARHHAATVWTQDVDFESLPDGRFARKK